MLKMLLYIMALKHVEFQKLKIQNFLSYGETPIEITFDKGITFITGYNKDEDDTNGVGKTSLIVDSLSFLLFGDTYRKINRALIKNNRTTGSCIVEGWFSVNSKQYHVTRSIDPNKLILEIDGEWKKYTKTVPETTKDIIDAIGISKNMFTNTIVMTNKDSLSFLNQLKENRIKFIEGILGLEVFSAFYKKAKDQLKEVEDGANKKRFQVDSLEKSITYCERNKDNADSINNDSINKIQQELDDVLNSELTDNENKILEYKNIKVTVSTLIDVKQKNINVANNKKYEITYDLNSKKSLLKELNSKNSSCPVCKRPYENHDQDQLDNEKIQISSEIEKLSENIRKIDKAIKLAETSLLESKSEIKNIEKVIDTLSQDQIQFNNKVNKIQLLTNRLTELKNFINPHVNELKKLLEEKLIIEAEYNNLKNETRRKTIIKDLASPTGVKSLMVKKVIDFLNERINYYLIRLKSPFRIFFDEFFEERLIHKDGIEYTYGSLSGGEAKRVDFSMLFAFRDIRRIQSNVSVNITVMDELFDSALSEKGMFNIIELLKEMGDECYYIITHRPSNVDTTGCKTINLIKENGVTTIESID